MDHLITAISDRYNLRRRSGRWVGPCPKCGGSTKTDKFVLQDDGGFKCYSCPFKGDIITWLREMDGMTCSQAHKEAGKECTASNCAVRETCPLGDGKGFIGKRRRTVRPPERKEDNVATVAEVRPEGRWQKWAVELVMKSCERMKGRVDDLAWLASRGIDAQATATFRLGWNHRGLKIARAAIGLSPRDDGKKTLWIPDGLVIPIMDETGKLHRLRIRRPLSSRERFLPDLKYLWIEGSGNAPLVLRPAGRIRGAVIVEAELDAFAIAGNHHQVMVISLGTVKGPLTAALKNELQVLPVILVALDADPGKDGKPGAGTQAIAAWTNEFRNARFWPVPKGKDAGEYAEQGGILHAWIEAGLPPVSASAAKAITLAHDLPLSAGCKPPGDGGEKKSFTASRGKSSAAVPEKPQAQRQQQKIHATRTTTEKTDPLAERIQALHEPARSDAMTIYEIIQGHPVEVWLSPDGRDAGLVDVQGDWRHRYPEISRKLTGLLYGPSCEVIFNVFHERFVSAARAYGKAV